MRSIVELFSIISKSGWLAACRGAAAELMFTLAPTALLVATGWVAYWFRIGDEDMVETVGFDMLMRVIGNGELFLYAMALLGPIAYANQTQNSLPWKFLLGSFIQAVGLITCIFVALQTAGLVEKDVFCLSVISLGSTILIFYLCKAFEHKAKPGLNVPGIEQRENQEFLGDFRKLKGTEK